MYREPFLDRVRRFAKYLLKNSRAGVAVYPFIQKVWRAFAIPARIRRLHRHGYSVLSDMHALLTANGIPYYCDCGTLLGFVRDGGFITHDDDIDICIMPDYAPLSHVLRIFLDAGYGFVHGFKYGNRFVEFTVKHPSHITIDVFHHVQSKEDKRQLDEIFIRWFSGRKYPNETANTGLLFHLRGPDGISKMDVHGIGVNVPSNAIEVLDSEYGPWRTPDSKFNSEQLPHEELPDFVYRLTKEEALKMT